MLIITSHDKVITNYVSFANYELRQSVVTNCDCFFIINYDKVLTNCDRYYKLQNYYKLRQLLQITVIITIYDKTIVKFSMKHFGKLEKKQFRCFMLSYSTALTYIVR